MSRGAWHWIYTGGRAVGMIEQPDESDVWFATVFAGNGRAGPFASREEAEGFILTVSRGSDLRRAAG